MPKSPTLNRFPLFGLFAHEAAKKMGYAEDDARLLGFSTALLYAIFKAKAQAKKEKAEPRRRNCPRRSRPRRRPLQFGGQEFQVIYGKGKRLKQTVVGHEVHDAEEYDSQIKAKFPEGWYDRLAKAFDKYLDGCDRPSGQGPIRPLQGMAGREQGRLQSRRSGKVGRVA